jgi:hypothetical protein
MPRGAGRLLLSRLSSVVMPEPRIVSLRLISAEPRSREIAELYWAQDEDGRFLYRVGEIAETFGVSARDVREISNESAVAESTSESCERCEEPRRYLSRQDVTSGWHRPYRWGQRRLCDGCVEELENEERRAKEDARRTVRERIARAFQVPAEPLLDIRSLSLEHAIALLALIRIAANENMTMFEPLEKAAHVWAPGVDYKYELLRSMADHVIWVDPRSSPVDAFIWENERPSYYLDKVSWRISGAAGDLYRVASEFESLFEIRDWPDSWVQASTGLQTILAANEFVEYLVERLAEHHFQFTPGEKTWDIAMAMAERLSIGQGYNLIWRAAKDAASFYVREQCDKRRATAYAVGTLRRSLERAAADGWTLKPYSRSWSIPESQIVHLYYRTFLGEADPMTASPPRPLLRDGSA